MLNYARFTMTENGPLYQELTGEFVPVHYRDGTQPTTVEETKLLLQARLDHGGYEFTSATHVENLQGK